MIPHGNKNAIDRTPTADGFGVRFLQKITAWKWYAIGSILKNPPKRDIIKAEYLLPIGGFL